MKNKTSISIIFILLYMIGWNKSLSQIINTPSYNAPTPTAADLGRYGDIPISYYTGNANITIPIYTFNVRGVELPIRFDYDTRGVQLNKLPGWTGYNWTLSAGGVVTRQVNGEADERIFPNGLANYPINRKPVCYFENHNQLSLDKLNTNDLYEHLVWNQYDYEPDMFYFNFMGHTGKFFLGNDGKWKIESNENFDVLFDINDHVNSYKYPFIEDYPCKTANQRKQPKTIGGFRLRDSNGTIYEFGNPQTGGTLSKTDAIEYTTPFLSMGDNEALASWIATSWYLTRVVDRLGNVLYELEYERGPFCAQVFRNYSITIKKEHASSFFGGSYGGLSGTSNWQLPYSLQLDAPVYLKQIKGANGVKVFFGSSLSPQGLRELYYNSPSEALSHDWYNQLKDRVNNTTGNNKQFYYLQDSQFSEYFADPTADAYNGMLERMGIKRLHNISIIADSLYYRYLIKYDDNGRSCISNIRRNHIGYNENTWDYEYKLEYYHKADLPTSALTSMVDHWGYYNGRGYSANGYSRLETLDSILYLTRQCDTSLVKYGALTKIVYPTGGVSVIDYEPNSYSRHLNESKTGFIDEGGYGAGLRVKSISEYDDTTCSRLLQSRTFEYTLPGSDISSGELYAKPKYYWPDWYAINDGQDHSDVIISTFRTTSIIPLTNTIGVPLGYSYVTERASDGSKKRYQFYNISNHSLMYHCTQTANLNTMSPTPFDKYTEHDSWRGKLLCETLIDSLGQEVKQTNYNYRSIGDIESAYDYAANFQASLSGESGVFSFYPGREYLLFHKRCDLLSTIERTRMDDGSFIHDTTSYIYRDTTLTIQKPFVHDTEVRVQESVELSRSGDKKTEVLTYSFSCDDNRRDMATNDFFLGPIAKSSYFNGSFIKGNEVLYGTFSNVTRDNNYHPLMPKYEIVNYATARDTIKTIDSYSASGQILKYTPSGQYPIEYIWGMNDCLPVVKCQSPASNARNIASLIENNPQIIFNKSLMTEALKSVGGISGYCPVMTGFVYNRLGQILVSVAQNGLATYYNYDPKSGNLHQVRDNDNVKLFQFDYDYKTYMP